jgi:hypothetical protein
MSKKSDTGHSVNVGNFEIVVSNCNSQKERYQPSKKSLQIAAINGQLTDVKIFMGDVNTTTAARKIAMAACEAAFMLCLILLTRLTNAIKASDIPKKDRELLFSIIKLLKGQRVSKKLEAEEAKLLEAEGKKQISAAHTKRVNRMEYMRKLIAQLLQNPEYSPNEEDLKISHLQEVLAAMEASHSNLIQAEIAYKDALAKRDKAIYTPGTGIVEVSLDIKSYYKSAFGVKSPEYGGIAGLKFTRIKN